MAPSFLAAEFLAKVRGGEDLRAADIISFVKGITDGSVIEAQIAAFTMAVYFKPLSMGPRTILTKAVRDSGEVLSWNLDGPVLDKHSTGGVGDNVSLLLGPIVAACGGYVPMISGQGLGHTGGTLDKFDAIPGYNTVPSNTLFRQTVKEIGCAIIGQTGSLAPADKRMYAVRSATATVESISLITASILSKKLAAGLDGLVLDIKCGNGAFMQSLSQAQDLASSLTHVANAAGVKTSAIITDMNQPLAAQAGNALEMRGAVENLTGTHINSSLLEVVTELSADMLVSGALAVDQADARTKVRDVLSNGKAAEVFAKMVAALGGPANFMDDIDSHLPEADIVQDIKAAQDGVVTAIDTRQVGMAVVVLGGGRKRPNDKIDYTVGFDKLAPLGRKVSKGDLIARVHASNEEARQEASNMLENAYTIGDSFTETPLIIGRVG